MTQRNSPERAMMLAMRRDEQLGRFKAGKKRGYQSYRFEGKGIYISPSREAYRKAMRAKKVAT